MSISNHTVSTFLLARLPRQTKPTATLRLAALALFTLSAHLAAQQASQDKVSAAPTWRLHASIASDPLGGTLLNKRDGLANSLGYSDAFGRSDRQAVGIGFVFAPNQELSLSLGLDRADGKREALGSVGGVRLAGVLSRFEALRYELGYRYSFASVDSSGFFLGAQIGRERRNAVSVRLANGRSETLFARGTGTSLGLSLGYQWRFTHALSLSLEIAPTQRPGFELGAGATALGISRRGKTDSAFSAPVSARFSYSF
jgi:hypothetical protein